MLLRLAVVVTGAVVRRADDDGGASVSPVPMSSENDDCDSRPGPDMHFP